MPSPGSLYGLTDPEASSAPLALIVMGVSGIGKSTIGKLLARSLGCEFHEGDDLHSAENVAKMRSGIPLTDEDRWPWLERIATVINAPDQSACVVSCSALRRVYRDYLVRSAAVRLLFVHPEVNRTTIADRMASRQNHYMPAGLLDSQLMTFEPPAEDEPVISVCGLDGPDTVVRHVLSAVQSRAS